MSRRPYQHIIPERKTPKNDNEYFEQLTKAIFMSTFSFKVVETKWNGFLEIFQQFDPYKVASWGEDEIIEAISSPKIIRNSQKVRATVYNARRFLEIIKEYGNFTNYIKSLRNLDYYEISEILSSKFKWMGRTGAFVFLFCINEEVPPWEER